MPGGSSIKYITGRLTLWIQRKGAARASIHPSSPPAHSAGCAICPTFTSESVLCLSPFGHCFLIRLKQTGSKSLTSLMPLRQEILRRNNGSGYLPMVPSLPGWDPRKKPVGYGPRLVSCQPTPHTTAWFHLGGAAIHRGRGHAQTTQGDFS